MTLCGPFSQPGAPSRLYRVDQFTTHLTRNHVAGRGWRRSTDKWLRFHASQPLRRGQGAGVGGLVGYFEVSVARPAAECTVEWALGLCSAAAPQPEDWMHTQVGAHSPSSV